MDESLRRLIASFLERADVLMDGVLVGQITPAQWERAFGKLLVEHHLAAYFTGRNTQYLTPESDRVLGRLMQEQLDYLRGFAAAREGLSEAQQRARAALYGGALKATYSRARWWEWPLPFYPTVGTECQTNCRCRWEARIISEEELDADFYWRMGPVEHCSTCITRAMDNPYQIRKGELL